MGSRAISCGLEGRCSIQFIIEADGSIYPCDFYVIDEWKLGNVYDTSYLDVLKSQLANDFVRNSMILDASCDGCKWLAICKGGCMRHRQGIKGVTISNQFCKSYKMFFEHAYDKLVAISKM